MLINLNNQTIHELSTADKDALGYVFLEEELEAEISRRLQWVIHEKVKGCKKQILEKYLSVLRKYGSTTLDEDQLISEIQALPEYKNRAAREREKLRIEEENRLAAQAKEELEQQDTLAETQRLEAQQKEVFLAAVRAAVLDIQKGQN